MRIVLDTNCLLMAISDRTHYHRVWQAFVNNEYTLCVTNEIIEEYVEVIGRNINQHVAETVVYIIMTRNNVLHIDPHFRFRLIESDPDDNKFVDCAIASNAKYIVSQDHHFDVLKRIPFPKVDVISIDSFLTEIE
ncbi:MAG: putative toxin-antitoxin system toxin component, PIN family [Bacteroidales bacterium]|nr:putative toxin-antitoxin system toxin component, PIN family [Bacteroidales bacterium]